MRTIVDLPASQIESLADWCKRQGLSRAEAIRQAVAHYLAQHVEVERDEAFGLWKQRDIDGLDYQERLRDEWPR